MVLQTSGPISFDNIRTEFGTGNNTLGQYRVSQSLGSSAGADFQNMRLDTDIPQSGSISFNDFYYKHHFHLIQVNCQFQLLNNFH